MGDSGASEMIGEEMLKMQKQLQRRRLRKTMKTPKGKKVLVRDCLLQESRIFDRTR